MEIKDKTCKPNIAVLLAAYNGEEWIYEQIKTILNQNDVNIHIYISVDLSTDNTYNIVRSLSEECSEITLLPYGEIFGSAAKNFYNLILNVPIEDYDYISLSDQDDIWLEDKLSKAIDKLNKLNADGYSSNVMAVWESGKKVLIKKSFPQRKYDYLFEAPGPGCTFLLKNNLIIGLKKIMADKKKYLFQLNMHDWFIYAYARSHNYKWIIDNKYYINYRQHNHNELGANFGYRAFINRIKIMLTGYGISQSILIINYLELQDIPFVQKWYAANKIDFRNLALNTNQCRRRRKDRFFFFVLCILLLIINKFKGIYDSKIYFAG
ncbi:dTDP-rhamnosyl transferase RfbG [Treponema primitia ZAS-2]|uniref:dTDP-rhamnosyl transferase RfbG n=1 Tax=Treponema primitia (strain ATCC BAA-887 / DSM 12427 / ZAS-2) TaxID=545694 RepID=F5YNZ5_TREPZ|nr:glycosyltransferase [Treponema primitia]AEF85131.1 dTDP-rhamnosyl transferase RfbG [Treponema primitia ZAS-2]